MSLFPGTTSPHINGALLTSYSPIEFFNPVIPTQDFEQSRNPEGYFWHPTSRAYFQSRNPPWFCCKIANGESRPANKGNPVSRKTYWGPSTLVLQTREEREGGWRRAYQNETQYICDNFPEYELLANSFFNFLTFIAFADTGNTWHAFVLERHRRKGRRRNTGYSGVNTGWYGLPAEAGEGEANLI